MTKKFLIISFIVLVLAMGALAYMNYKKKKEKQPDPLPPAPDPIKNMISQDHPAPVKALPATPIVIMGTGSFPLRYGSKGKLVQFIQVVVGVTPDGVWGRGTDIAIAKTLKLKQIDLMSFLKIVSAESNKTDFPLEYGSQGNYVKALQIMLGLKIDGLFGKTTERAVFQEIGQAKVTKDDYLALVKQFLK